MASRIVVNGKSIVYDGIRNRGRDMPDPVDWGERAKGLLKAELKRRGVTYAELAQKLSGIGVTETEPNIRNKIARGGFTAQFLLQCMEAIGAKDLRLDYGA